MNERSCPYCAETILLAAKKCKHCGEFLDGSAIPDKKPSVEAERELWVGAPSAMNFFFHIIFGSILLPVFGLGLLVFLDVWLRIHAQKYTVTSKRVIQRTGFFSNNTAEVAIRDIRSVNVSQGVVQRIFGLGTIDIGSAGHSGIEVQFKGVAQAQHVKSCITTLIQRDT